MSAWLASTPTWLSTSAVSTIAAAAGPLALVQRGEDSHDRIDAGEDIGDRNPGALGLAIRRPGQVHDPAHALSHQVVARAGGIGPGLAEAGDRAIDQARAFLAQAGIVEAEFGEPANLEILDQHVRARRQLANDAPPVLALEIDLDRAFAAIGGVEIGGTEMAAVLALDEGRAPAPRVVTGAFALDLDHVGAEIGENLPGPRSRQDAGEFQHA